jgi:DNA-binding NtrC family response regulator
MKSPWPDNVRELKRAVKVDLIIATGKKLNFDLPQMAETPDNDLKSLEEMEREYILRVLKARNWKIGGKTAPPQPWGCTSIRFAAV